jgi:hypothetical protein
MCAMHTPWLCKPQVMGKAPLAKSEEPPITAARMAGPLVDSTNLPFSTVPKPRFFAKPLAPYHGEKVRGF